ncbi:MAG TPA: type II secretion system protein [Candidatus Woesebacteria bacterium]|nr:type II secretion system protein [Candidatus Woesebacteria bacterium]
MKNKKGFTLIELIVSITIIAVLTVAGVISYGGANKKARDNRRMADLEKIRIALELYRQGTGSSYPSSLGSLVPIYIQTIPVGPKGEDYSASYIHSAYTYSIGVSMEETGLWTTVINP